MPGPRSLGTGGEVCIVPDPFWGWGVYTKGGGYVYPHLQTWDLGSPPHPLTGGHHNTYSWKAGGAYPIGMLSC